MDKERGPEHYNAILLEEIRSQMELVLEKVTGSEDRLMTAIREDISLLKQAAGSN